MSSSVSFLLLLFFFFIFFTLIVVIMSLWLDLSFSFVNFFFYSLNHTIVYIFAALTLILFFKFNIFNTLVICFVFTIISCQQTIYKQFDSTSRSILVRSLTTKFCFLFYVSLLIHTCISILNIYIYTKQKTGNAGYSN
jgi:hypothetical protein